MKFKATSVRFPALAAIITLALFSAPGCSRHEHADVTTRVKEAVAGAKNSLADTWKDVKTYGYEKRKEFSDNARDLTTKMDSQVQQLRANYSESKASASRKAAMAELKNCESDYRQKVAALGRATADTWDRAKRDVIDSWNRLQEAYKKAQED